MESDGATASQNPELFRQAAFTGGVRKSHRPRARTEKNAEHGTMRINGHWLSKTQRVSTGPYCMECTAALALVQQCRHDGAGSGYQGPPLTCTVRTQWRTQTQDVRKARRSQQPAPRAFYIPVRPTDSSNPATPAPTISFTQSAREPGARRAPPSSMNLCSRVESNPKAPPPPQTPIFSVRGSSLVRSENVPGDRNSKTAEHMMGSRTPCTLPSE